MDEKTLETQQVVDEQLGDVTGGTRDNVRLETRACEAAAAEDASEDQAPIPFLKCPVCKRSYRLCTCRL